MVFTGAILALACVVSAILAWPMLRTSAETVAENPDIEVYKDQIKQLDAEIKRGLIGDGEAETTRVELARRLLAATQKENQPVVRVNKLSARIGGICVAVVTLISIGALYFHVGRPDLPDAPLLDRREIRLSQAEAQQRAAPLLQSEAPAIAEQDAALITQLEEVLAERPDDMRGLRILANAQASVGQFAKAATAQNALVALTEADTSADDLATLAEYLIFAARGYVSPEAEALLLQALNKAPSHQQARYYLGITQAQQNKPQQAIAIWQALLQEGPADAPWKIPVRQQLATLMASTSATSALGPSQEDIEAAQEMTPQERMEMIRGMVDGLSMRLATAGGTPDEWARLIAALGVLGENQQAEDIYKEAQGIFADRPDALAIVNSAAQSAGLSR